MTQANFEKQRKILHYHTNLTVRLLARRPTFRITKTTLHLKVLIAFGYRVEQTPVQHRNSV
jgi:hypothetical protein